MAGLSLLCSLAQVAGAASAAPLTAHSLQCQSSSGFKAHQELAAYSPSFGSQDIWLLLQCLQNTLAVALSASWVQPAGSQPGPAEGFQPSPQLPCRLISGLHCHSLNHQPL